MQDAPLLFACTPLTLVSCHKKVFSLNHESQDEISNELVEGSISVVFHTKKRATMKTREYYCKL